jgi:hypothetical protein
MVVETELKDEGTQVFEVRVDVVLALDQAMNLRSLSRSIAACICLTSNVFMNNSFPVPMFDGVVNTTISPCSSARDMLPCM